MLALVPTGKDKKCKFNEIKWMNWTAESLSQLGKEKKTFIRSKSSGNIQSEGYDMDYSTQ